MKDLENKFDELFQLYKQLEKYTDGVARYYSGIRLFPSEIHLLVFIKDNPDLNMTELAEQRNISKGALSKVLTKLLEKDLIQKYNKNGNSKNIYFTLTSQGLQAYQGHLLFHQKHDRKHSPEMIAFLNENYEVLKQAICYTKSEIQAYITEFEQEK